LAIPVDLTHPDANILTQRGALQAEAILRDLLCTPVPVQLHPTPHRL